MTLGCQLQQITRREIEHSDEAYNMAARPTTEAEALLYLKEVEDFFEYCKRSIESDILVVKRHPRPIQIERGMTPKVAKILGVHTWEHQTCIQAPSHEYHAIWKAFLQWAQAQNLTVSLNLSNVHSGTFALISVFPLRTAGL